MPDLGELLSSAEGRLARAAGPTDSTACGVAPRTRALIRRRRATRHAFQSVAGVLVVGAVASGAWLGLRGPDTPPPATVPSATSTPTPSSATSPTPSVSPTQAAVPAVLDELPGLPPTQPLPAGLLERTTPGWVLTVYRSEPYSAADEELVVVRHTVVLVSPAGERYRVVDLPPESSVQVVDWVAGRTTALVRVDAPDGEAGGAARGRAVLDLRSGAITPAGAGVGATDDTFLGRSADGAEIWTSSAGSSNDVHRVDEGGARRIGVVGQWPSVDPTGRWLVATAPGTASSAGTFTLVDLVGVGGGARGTGLAGRGCDVVGWLDGSDVLLVCSDSTTDELPSSEPAHPALWRWDVVDGGTPEHLTDLRTGDPYPWVGGSWVRPGVLALGAGEVGTDGCGVGAYTWDGSFTLLQAPTGRSENIFLTRSQGGATYVESSPGCSGDVGPAEVTLHRADGTSTVLAPVPPTTPDVKEWASGVVTWAVGR